MFPTRRRQSIESGVTLLGDRNNYEEASLRALAGSTYCDDKVIGFDSHPVLCLAYSHPISF